MSALHLVLSGGPCTGKTKLAYYLERQYANIFVYDGVATVDEVMAIRARERHCLVIFLKAKPASVGERAGMRRVMIDLRVLQIEEIADEKVRTDDDLDDVIILVEHIIHDHLTRMRDP